MKTGMVKLGLESLLLSVRLWLVRLLVGKSVVKAAEPPAPEETLADKDCTFWYDMCTQEKSNAVAAFDRGDHDAFEKAKKSYHLCSSRFLRAAKEHYGVNVCDEESASNGPPESPK